MKIKNITSLIVICAITIFAGAVLVRAEESGSTTRILPAIKGGFEKKDIRNMKVTQRENIRDIRASTTNQIREAREEMREDIRDIRASTTLMFKKIKDDKKVAEKKMRLDTFTIRKNTLEKELRVSLENLTKTRNQLVERITKAESSGRNMTIAKASLVIANDKLAKAKTAVDTFASTTYSTASTTASSTELSLDKPRKIGDAAIKAVKDAKEALKKVVQDIAHSMGFRIGQDGRVSTTTTATTTNTTATTTATTTSI